MSEMKAVIAAIKKMLTDLSKLDDEQLEGVMNGTLKFKCESAARKAPSPTKGGARSESALDDAAFEQHKAALLAGASRAEATRYLDQVGMKVIELKRFAKYLDLKNVPTSGKDNITKAIVDQTVGYRLDSKAVYEP